MCMIDSADGYCVVLHEIIRKSRKDHRCSECGRIIEVGELYLNEGLMWEGKKNTVKTCSHCQVVRAWLNAECGGWLYEGVYEDIHEHVQEEFYGKAVLMLAVGMSRRWKKKNGEMYRVPSLPKTTHQRMAA